jgi:hypothetical protein
VIGVLSGRKTRKRVYLGIVNRSSGREKANMTESRSHKIAANRIAKKFSTEYNEGEGVDIKTQRATVEVETPETVADAPAQLRGHRGPVYIAGTNQEAVERALGVTKGTTIGVMDGQGNIVKSSTREK